MSRKCLHQLHETLVNIGVRRIWDVKKWCIPMAAMFLYSLSLEGIQDSAQALGIACFPLARQN